MKEYFDLFFVQHIRGVSYYLTTWTLTVCSVFLLSEFPKTVKKRLLKIGECFLCCAFVTLFTAIYYALFGDMQMDRISIIVFIAIYAGFFSKYSALIRIVRVFVYTASIIVILPVSAPLGELFRRINESYYSWAQYLTIIAVIVMSIAEVWFLRKFSLKNDTVILFEYAFLLVGISAMTITLEIIYLVYADSVPAEFNAFVSLCLWIINLLTYYLFYQIGRQTSENIALLSTNLKAEMEREKYEANRINYEKLRELRHEVKNHNFYVKALLDAGKYEDLSAFVTDQNSKYNRALNSYDCGNYIIDVIMNHCINTALSQGINVEPDILVPHQLPFADEDLCSLISNLMDNAIDAAAASGEDSPQVYISIRPKQEYLFIRMVNSVCTEVSPDRRLTLETTKEDNRELHGYGTKVIRNIVRKYNGSIKYSMEKNRFTTDVMLELNRDPTPVGE